MSTLIIPETALVTSNAFKDWCSKAHETLFGCPFIDRTTDRRFPTYNTEKGMALFTDIMSKVNFVLNEDPVAPDITNKNKKYPTKISDVISITCCIIVEQYDVRLSHLSKMIGLNHSSLIYYKKKLDALFFNGKEPFVKKYAMILMSLLNSGILPTIKTPRPEVEKYIRDKQVFMEKFKATLVEESV
jgi:hypothetical protein